MQNDVRNLSGRFSAVVFKCLLKLSWGCFAALPLALFLPPLYTSLPQAFCSSATREEGMVERHVRHSVRVSEFLLRHGSAPTRLQTYSNTQCTWNTHAHTHTHILAVTHKAHVAGNKHGKTWRYLIFYI